MKKENPNRKRISPCFCVKADTQHIIKKLSEITGLSRNTIVEIALSEVCEHDLSERELCGISRKSEEQEKNLFNF